MDQQLHLDIRENNRYTDTDHFLQQIAEKSYNKQYKNYHEKNQINVCGTYPWQSLQIFCRMKFSDSKKCQTDNTATNFEFEHSLFIEKKIIRD